MLDTPECQLPLSSNFANPSAVLPDYTTLPQKERDLLLSQQKAWKTLFGGYIDIPRPPHELFETMDHLKKKGYDTFKPLYIPEVTTTKNVIYPGWKEKPHELLYDQDDHEQRITNARWTLIDTRSEGTSVTGGIGRFIDKLKEEKETQNKKDASTNWHEERRASGDEVKTVILPAFADAISVDKSNVTLPTLLEYNLLDNTGDVNTWETKTNEEWTNSYRPDDHAQRVVVSIEDKDQEGYATYAHSDEAKAYIGFRPMINFPQEK